MPKISPPRAPALDASTPEGARAMFRELSAQRDAIEAVSGPLREARDKFSRETDQKLIAMNAEITVAETSLFDLKMRIAHLVRMLGGRTAESPAA